MRREILISLLLAAVTIGVYWSVRTHDFVNYDDPLYVTENPRVQAGLSRANVAWAFGKLTSEERTYWHPVTWLSHMLDCQLFGVNAGAHHLINLLFHTLNVVLLFLTLRRATGCDGRSCVVAALFALHPLQVDTVAWIAERKNVLSTFFWLLTLLAYVRYARKPGLGRYWPVLFLFALGLMAKPMLVTLPFVLLLMDYWPLCRIADPRFGPARGAGICGAETADAKAFFPATPGRLLMEKLPLLLLAIVVGALTIIAHQRLNLMATMEQIPLDTRLGLSLHAYAGYLSKMVWPVRLAVFYPLELDWSLAVIVGDLLLVGVISILALKLARSSPWLMVGWCWFLGTLVPVIGIFQVSYQALADRWAYVPMIGFCLMIVWGAFDLLARWRWGKPAAFLLAFVTVAACAVVTHVQLGYWQNSETLFRHALAVTKDNQVAHLNLGVALAARGKLEEADSHFEEVLRLMPNSSYGHEHHGGILAQQGRFEEALTEYSEALRLNPNDEQIQFNFANLLALCKRFDEAREHFEATLRINPYHAGAENNLGNTLILQGRLQEAIPHFERAIELNPKLFEAHYFLAGALARQKDFAGAIKQFHAALEIKKDYPSALNDLAWIMATEAGADVHDPANAIQFAKRACALTDFQDPGYLDTLAVAYSEAGRFPEAIEMTRKAVTAARNAGDDPLAEKIGSRLKFYERHVPYRSIARPASAAAGKSKKPAP